MSTLAQAPFMATCQVCGRLIILDHLPRVAEESGDVSIDGQALGRAVIVHVRYGCLGTR